MPRYIDADKLQPDTSVFLSVYSEQPVKVYSQERIDNAPTEDVAPVKHGRWINNKHTDTAICSECKRVFTDDTNFCPNCGAKMDGGEGK